MNDLDDRLQIVSHFPGRLRVRAGRFRSDPNVAEATVKRLASEPGVVSASAAALTGSILVLYEPSKVEVGALVAAVLAEGQLSSVEADGEEHAHGTQVATRIVQAVTRMNTSLFRAASGKLDMRTAVPGALVLGGFAKLLFGRFAPPQWYDLVFWSYVTFNNLHIANAPNAPRRDTSSDGL